MACALGIAAGIGPIFGVPARQIHVEWRSGQDPERLALERQWQLSEGTRLSGNRWSYIPLDTRPSTLQAVASHPRVAGTDGIDRDTFALSDNGPLTARRGGWLSTAPRRAAPAAKLAAYALTAGGALCLMLALIAARQSTPAAVLAAARQRVLAMLHRLRRAGLLAAARVAALRLRLPSWMVFRTRAASGLQRGIPVASPESAGLFRVIFGIAVVGYLMSNPVSPSLLTSYELPRAEGPYGSLMLWLASRPGLVRSLEAWIPIAGALFVAGAATPASYAAFVVAALIWASVASLGTSHHVVSILCVALVALLPARWGDGLSVDAWLRRRSGGPPAAPSRRYGYTMWLPMFVFGVGFAAAAWSKLRQGPEWILHGTVKYHFISDFDQALVPWGLELTAFPALAVALSAATVVVETLVVTAAFSRSAWYRLGCGLVSLVMLAGFAMFQGVVWLGWWILLLGFLPWHWLRTGRVPAAAGSVGAVQFVAVLLVVGQQLYASWERIEARPLISAYDMYSTTYASPAAYEEASNLVYRVVGITSTESTDLSGCIIDEPAARVFVQAAAGDAGERQRVRSLIGECLDGRPDVRQVLIEGDREVFDWDTRQFGWKRALDRFGPVDAAWLRDGTGEP